NDGGDTIIYNNSWETQYVVDQSTVDGLKGTFTTIQAAFDQAVLDGMTQTSSRKFYIRRGTYTESLNIPAGVMIVGDGYGVESNQMTHSVIIIGNHQLASISQFTSVGIRWEAPNANPNLFNGSNLTLVYVQFIDSTLFHPNALNGRLLNLSSLSPD